MKTRAAILRKSPGSYEIAELDLEGPRSGELLVRLVASGICHSDDHIATGDLPPGIYPYCGGHEGAGMVEEVGAGTIGWDVGDHLVFAGVPSCGHCRWCAEGKPNLCNLVATVLPGSRPYDPTSYRMSLDGVPVGQAAGISTFSELTTVAIESAVKVPKDLSLNKLCLLGCGVSTGWGSSVNIAAVTAGEHIIVMGIGGIGISAVQGAIHAGASSVIAVDPLAFKRESAIEFGATDAVETIEQATELVRDRTDGQGADATLITCGIVNGMHISQALDSIRKAGTVVVVGAGPHKVTDVPINLVELVIYQKRILGSLFGGAGGWKSIPQLIELYANGRLRLDEMVTKTYKLDDIAQGFQDMHEGKVIRGVIEFDTAVPPSTG